MMIRFLCCVLCRLCQRQKSVVKKAILYSVKNIIKDEVLEAESI